METCCLCQAKGVKPTFKKNGYQFLKCSNCGLYQLVLEEPYRDFLKRYYDQGYFQGDPNRCAYLDYWDDRRVIQKNMQVYLTQILKHKKSGRLLDVGCSLGLFLELAEKAGFEPYGVDVSEYAISIAKPKFGNRVQQTELKNASLTKGSFDVISLFDVIEHFQDPKGELRRVNRLLKPNGLVIIETANVESPWAKLLGRHWHFFAPPQHLFIFGRSHLETLLTTTGFESIAIMPHHKWVSLRYLLHLTSSITQLPGSNWLSGLAQKSFFGKWPVYLPLGDKMIITAFKTTDSLDQTRS